MVSDAPAAAKVVEGDEYPSALINFRFMANTVPGTEEVTKVLRPSREEGKATLASPLGEWYALRFHS